MILCSDGHAELAYEDKVRNCPMCIALEELEEKNTRMVELEDKINDLESQVESLDASMDELKSNNDSRQSRDS